MKHGGSMITLYLWRLDPRGAALQRHGCGQGGARSVGALSGHGLRAAGHKGSTACRPDRCARWPARAFRMRACCSISRKCTLPLGRTPSLDEVGGSALYLLSDLSTAVSGRNPLRGFRVQHRGHAAPGNHQRDGRGDGGRFGNGQRSHQRGRAKGRGVAPRPIARDGAASAEPASGRLRRPGFPRDDVLCLLLQVPADFRRARDFGSNPEAAGTVRCTGRYLGGRHDTGGQKFRPSRHLCAVIARPP